VLCWDGEESHKGSTAGDVVGGGGGGCGLFLGRERRLRWFDVARSACEWKLVYHVVDVRRGQTTLRVVRYTPRVSYARSTIKQ
jgi:hypothetical protein